MCPRTISGNYFFGLISEKHHDCKELNHEEDTIYL